MGEGGGGGGGLNFSFELTKIVACLMREDPYYSAVHTELAYGHFAWARKTVCNRLPSLPREVSVRRGSTVMHYN